MSQILEKTLNQPPGRPRLTQQAACSMVRHMTRLASITCRIIIS
jgi:hypothetical protein